MIKLLVLLMVLGGHFPTGFEYHYYELLSPPQTFESIEACKEFGERLIKDEVASHKFDDMVGGKVSCYRVSVET